MQLGPVAAALLLVASPALADLGISIHLVPADGDPFDVSGEDLRCATLQDRGDPTGPQYAYFVVSGTDRLWSVQFGIDYDDGVHLGTWTALISGVENMHHDWPAPRSGLAMVWGHCLEPRGEENLIVIGCVEVEAESWGRIWITHYDQTIEGHIETCTEFRGRRTKTILEGPSMMGMARVHGVHPGRRVCW